MSKEKYYVHTTGDHEVHKSDCGHKPEPENRLYLGEFYSCEDAVKEAKKTYDKVNGCYWCCNSCHTS